jgi:hypothetical protein
VTTRTKLGIVVAVAIIFAGSAHVLYWHVWRSWYPFGMQHRCDKQLAMALEMYAERHGGAFPSGQATPEASLSLIGVDYDYLLPRREIPVEVVHQMLERGQLLGPETCGWNYVEGLRRDSDRGLALFWDKEGLDEMGGRLSDGGHIVTFVTGFDKYVPASQWDSFLAEQQELLAAEREKTKNK